MLNPLDLAVQLADENPALFGLITRGLPSPASDLWDPNDRLEFVGRFVHIGWLDQDEKLLLDPKDGTVYALISGEEVYVNRSLAAFYRAEAAAAAALDSVLPVQRSLRRALEAVEPGCTGAYTFWSLYIKQMTLELCEAAFV